MNFISQEVKHKVMRAAPGTVVLLNAPVGSGKTTFCIEDLWTSCRIKARNLLLLVNRAALRGQLVQKVMKRQGLEDMEVEGRGCIEFDSLTIASYQYLEMIFRNSLNPKAERIGAHQMADFSYVVCDEVHYLISDSTFSPSVTYLKHIPKAFHGAVRVYMSATLAPVRRILLQLENIHDCYEEQEFDFTKKLLPFRYIETGLRRCMVDELWQLERPVLELDAAEADFTYLRPVIFEEGMSLDNLILKEAGQGNTGKWLAFVESKEEGRRVKEALKHRGISAAFVSSDKMEADDMEVLSGVLSEGIYDVHVLLATPVLDNGVSIVDPSVSNLVISGYEAIQGIQQVGRIRLQSPGQTVRLFVCRYSAEYFNRKRHSFHMKRKTLSILKSGDQGRLVDHLMEDGGQYVKDLAVRGPKGGFYYNYFAEGALGYFINELDDNIRRLKEDEDGFIKKALAWYGLMYLEKDDLMRQRQNEAKDCLMEMLAGYEGKEMQGAAWGQFRCEFRTLYEEATNQRLCSGKGKRLVGVARLKALLPMFGYELASQVGKIYILRRRGD
ncbi:hypothetical protein GPL26_24330 [Enterocloster citroniae]|uniref:Helicase ATP-binding domain-containing protein n=1 Tax=Enterocloster citroniae TaxID=358743 RepID=A0AA41FJ52_9FIRM|nr:DEAD/DEAH box helicase family protein [Enterocloster citroniae]MBT9812729.1 hypothetical protein [Enterocloster citroniae]